MRKNYKILLSIVAVSAVLWSFKPKFKTNDPEKDKILLEMITVVIDNLHYNPVAVDDTFSKNVYDSFLESLDPSKRFFIDSDIREFSTYEHKIDDMILSKDLQFFNLAYDRLKKRMNETKVIYRALNNQPFDFTVDETINIDSEKNNFATNYNDLKNRWRLQIKLSTLASIVDKQKLEEDKKAKDPAYQMKSFEQIEKESREATIKNLDEYFEFVTDLDKEDWFNVYLNAIVTQYDPHTFYFAPEEKEKFDISMSGKMEGIGARLQKKNDNTEISELISGGPAWKSKELEPGDVILKVAQGASEPVEITGMRLDDVVKKIKGPKGTEVRLTIKKVDGAIKVVRIIRDIIEIEETYAKSSIILKNGKKFGLIHLPKFYIDFENDNTRDAAKDIELELAKLKKAGVEGIVMDLRDNGGGSLKTVVDIVGLFIPEGPVVQVKSFGNKKEVLTDHDPKTQWDGPLVVLQNNFSASASEIFSAAIQDYKRGIIIGSKQSFGKGTVQNVIDLNQIKLPGIPRIKDAGALKTTTQKYYRINGGATQLQGVNSDIVIPDRYMYMKIGERDEKRALPWDKIDQANYKQINSIYNFSQVLTNSSKRIAESSQFKLIGENAKWLNDRKDDNIVSLRKQDFLDEQKEVENQTKRFKDITKYKNNLEITNLTDENEQIKKDVVFAQKRKEWFESIAKDAYIDEAINVLFDIKTTTPINKNLVAKKPRVVAK